jgi:hypothetical protein
MSANGAIFITPTVGIGKLQFLIKKIPFYSPENIYKKIWSPKPRIQIGIQPKMLDPDPDLINTDYGSETLHICTNMRV